ncbi:MAG: lytic transglycosylase domain-containing protein [Caulobacterales bacterium]
MTRILVMLAVALGAAFALSSLAQTSHAATLQALSPQDVQLYSVAFDAAEKGDFATADQSLAQVKDPCLVGRVEYLKLTHARARTVGFDQLAAWLKAFGDLPGADRVYALALKLKPAGVVPPAPTSPLIDASPTFDAADRPHASTQSRAAREAYFDGDVSRALNIARASGDFWIAGLASYRLGAFQDAMTSFEAIAVNPAENDWVRSAGAFWAARSASDAGMPDRAAPFLKIAAAMPDTFYGMIAARKLELEDDPLGRVIDAAVAAPPGDAAGQASVAMLMQTDNRARRAVALMQLGRPVDAGAELRAGYAQAPRADVRSLWTALMYALNPQSGPQPELQPAMRAGGAETALHADAAAYAPPTHQYPVPQLSPTGGFTTDKALVYAITWQESRFDSLAVSPVGAIGLMQLMPPSAASVAGDDTLKSDVIPLFDVGKNLQLGQAYMNWLMSKGVNYDLLRVVAAYNGGPSTVNRTQQMLGANADTLLIIESVPFSETRAYVHKVMAAYWSYRRQFGAPSPTLDAVASGSRFIDARLDPSLGGEQAKPANPPAMRQALEVSLHRPG